MAEKLLAAIAANPHELTESRLALTASAGIEEIAASVPTNPVALARGLAKGAQKQGGNRVWREPAGGDQQDGDSEQETLNRLRTAVGQRQFRLLYQPIASLSGGNEQRYEAMLYLPEQGTLAPLDARSLHVAAKHGLVKALDRILLVGAAAELRAATATHIHLYSNLHGESLADAGFAGWLTEQLRGQSEQARRLCLTFAEAELSEQMEAALIVRQIAEQYGTRFVIDEFGSTDQGRALLHRLRPDEVRFDPALIGKIAEQPEQQACLERLVNEAGASGAATTAVGVRNAQTLSILWTYRIDLIQGEFLRAPALRMDFDFALQG